MIGSRAAAKQEPKVPTTPAYQLVIEHITAGIRAGLYPVGSQLPTIVRLAEITETNPTAVKTALLLLNQRGIVRGHQGKGSFVEAHPDRSSE